MWSGIGESNSSIRLGRPTNSANLPIPHVLHKIGGEPRNRTARRRGRPGYSRMGLPHPSFSMMV